MNQENIAITDISDISLSPINENVGEKYNIKNAQDITISDIDFSDCKKREPLQTITNIQGKNIKKQEDSSPQQMSMGNTLKPYLNSERTQEISEIAKQDEQQVSPFQEKSCETSENDQIEEQKQFKMRLSIRNQEAMQNFSKMVSLKTDQARKSFKQLVKTEISQDKTELSEIKPQEPQNSNLNRSKSSINQSFLEDYMPQPITMQTSQNETPKQSQLLENGNDDQDINTDYLLNYDLGQTQLLSNDEQNANLDQLCPVVNNQLKDEVKTIKKSKVKAKKQSNKIKKQQAKKYKGMEKMDDLHSNEISSDQKQQKQQKKIKNKKNNKLPPKVQKKNIFKKKKKEYIIISDNKQEKQKPNSPTDLTNLSIETDLLLQSLQKSDNFINNCIQNNQAPPSEFETNQSKLTSKINKLLTVSTEKIELSNILLTEIRECSFEIFSKSTKKFVIDLKIISEDLQQSCFNGIFSPNGGKETSFQLNSTCSVVITPYSFVKVNFRIINQCERDVSFSGKIVLTYNQEALEIPIVGNYVVPKLQIFSKGEQCQRIEKMPSLCTFLQVTFENQNLLARKQQKSIIIKNTCNVKLTIQNQVETGNNNSKEIFFFPKISTIDPNEKISISIFKKSVEHNDKALFLIGIKETDIVYPIFLNFQQ